MKKINIELLDEHLVKKGVKSIIDFYKTLSIDHREFSESIAFVTGVNSPFLNVFLIFEHKEAIVKS